MEPTSPNQKLSKVWPRGAEAVLEGIKGKIVFSDDHGNVRLERGIWKAKSRAELLSKPESTPHS